MANFFDWLNRSFEDESPKDIFNIKARGRFTPAETLFATSILILSELAKTREQQIARRREIATAKRLQNIGFSNAYEVAKIEQYNKNVELLTFMCQMWRDLGHRVILIGHEQFRSILRKHDLMCVPFSHYKGDIPQKNLAEIETALKSVNNKKTYAGYTPTSLFSRSAHELIDNIRFPWYYSGRDEAIGTPGALHFTYNTKFRKPLFIAAPKDFVEKPSVGFYESDDFPHFSWDDSNDYAKTRNRANAILREIRDYANVEYATAPKRLPYNYDPFICSLCDKGVIIHSMWGAEAEDATIKRYEQLRDAVIGKGGAR